MFALSKKQSCKMLNRMHVLSCFSLLCLCVTLWAVVHEGPLSMEFSRQEYWGGLQCPPQI